MKKQLLIAGLMALATTGLKADRFYEIFHKPYRQQVGLAVTGTMMAGGAYKFGRSVAGKRPAGALLSAGLIGAGAFGALIVEGNSPKPKVFGPFLRKYEQTFPAKPTDEISVKEIMLLPFAYGTERCIFAFDKAMDKVESGLSKTKQVGLRFKTFATMKKNRAVAKTKVTMNRIKSYFRPQK